MNKKERTACNAIIHSASLAAGGVGAGLAQLPGSDSAAIVPLQIGMIVSLGKVFGIEMTWSAAQATVMSELSTMMGRAVSQALIGWIPGLGNVTNAATAAGVTETLGWGIANEFAKNREAAVY